MGQAVRAAAATHSLTHSEAISRSDRARIHRAGGHRVDQRGPDDDARGTLGDPRQLSRERGDRGRVEVDAGPRQVGGVGHEDRRPAAPDELRQVGHVPGGAHDRAQLLHPVGPSDDVHDVDPVGRMPSRNPATQAGGADHALLHLRLHAQPVAVGRPQPGFAPGAELLIPRPLQRADEVVERAVAVGVLAQVGGDAGGRGVVTEVGDQLTDDRGALGVGDAVEVLQRRRGVGGRRPGDRVGAWGALRRIPPGLAGDGERRSRPR